jgi:hypothetical protein
MIEFSNDDTGYIAWVTANPDGFVLNVQRNANPNCVILHRARCGSISSGKRAAGAYTAREYRKICAGNVAELQRAARREGRSDGSFSKRCGLCQP